MRIIYQLLLVISIFCFYGCSDKISGDVNKQLIKELLANLSQIETANYISTSSAYNVYDTITPVYKSDHYFKEYINPSDTFVGVNFIRLNASDTNKMEFCYDGFMRSRVHWEEGTIEIDSFRTMRFPYREVTPSFFARAKVILEYINETNDSISYTVRDFGDSLSISLTIYDTVNVVDFIFGNQSIYNPQVKEMYEMDFSRYDIWISSADYLPYKLKRDLPHDISIERVRNVRINKDNISNFTAKTYFPNLPLKERKNQSISLDLKEAKAPIWSLKDTKDEIVSLEDFRGKMVLIEFTGIGCGPCHAAIPFLKQLAKDKKVIEIISIETWTKNLNTIQRYQEKQNLNYTILKSDGLVEEQYNVQSVPQFFILDRNHRIIEIIQGYSPGITDEQIKILINKHST